MATDHKVTLDIEIGNNFKAVIISMHMNLRKIW